MASKVLKWGYRHKSYAFRYKNAKNEAISPKLCPMNMIYEQFLELQNRKHAEIPPLNLT
jgi:hypothetical protein